MSVTTSREVPFARPWIGEEERAAAARVLDGHVLTHGPECQAFEAEFAAFLGPEAHAVTVSSCMAALHLAYLALGIGPGDEVIVPAQTHVATAHAVAWVGATPVFVDCDAATGNVTPEGVGAAITPRTRAVAVVHFLGVPCDMPAIVAVAERHGLRVVEDCALALGARTSNRHVGLFGDAGCFSFYPTKHITTGEGGMFVTRHADLARAVGRLRAFGVDRSHTERAMPGVYDVPTLGLNYRMGETQAAIGRVQLHRIEENLARRRENFATLRRAAGAAPGIRVIDGPGNSHYCLSLVLDDARAERRGRLVERLREAGIGTSVYYPHPVPRLAYYRNRYGYDPACFPHAARVSDGSVALPVGPHLSTDDVAYLAGVLEHLAKGA